VSVAIRSAVPEDAENLVALRRTIFGETDFMLYAPDEYVVTVVEASEQIERMTKSEHSRTIVASVDSTLVGLLNVMGSSIPRIRHSATIALGVRRSHWGQGIGSRLLEEALRWAPSAGLSRLELYVALDNARAASLYEKLGFRVEGRRSRAYVINGRPVDDQLMSYVFAA
jgi:RimJ/RimL family protein N-acetyltransferase